MGSFYLRFLRVDRIHCPSRKISCYCGSWQISPRELWIL